MAYEVIARKWRPQRFADVVGQEHITRTLQNAIARDRIGHAYLFVGPRGIGKTTSARIFAKALNCERPDTTGDGPEPCCQCQTCKEIAAGNCLDVLEIDGASNNSVDDIRDLRETVQYAPTNGRRYKVYIIDEVHMLTQNAWNALLKTLEEPPSHVKFLFATTEVHKVLATVLSRCQRFDLKRIGLPLIAGRLRQIATAEHVAIDDAAIATIARAADGGMRDAQSIFDQIISFCGGDDHTITDQDVIEVFGLPSRSELRHLVDALLDNDANLLITTIHNIADRGRNLERLTADLLQYLRSLMVVQQARDARTILDVDDAEYTELTELARRQPPAVVQRLLDGMIAHDGDLRHTLNKRIYLEAALLRLMRDAHALSVDELVTQLRLLQEKGHFAEFTAARPAPHPPAVATVQQVESPRPEPEPEPEYEQPEPQPEEPEPEPEYEEPEPQPEEPELGDYEPEPEPPPAPPKTPVPEPRAPHTPSLFALDDEEAEEEDDDPESPASGDPVVVPEAQTAIDDVRGDEHSQMRARDLWGRLVRQGSTQNALLDDALLEAVPLACDNALVTVGIASTLDDRLAELLKSARTRDYLARRLTSLAGNPLQFRLVTVAEADLEPERPTVSKTELKRQLAHDPFVQAVCQIFDGQIVDVGGPSA